MFFAIGRILRPIKALTTGAQRIAGGDFEHTINTSTSDEIQALAQQFNSMAGALKDSYTDLEQRVEQRTEELARSEDQYRALFEESRDAIFVSGSDGRVVAANQAALDLFEFTSDEAMGSDVGDRYVDQAERERFREEIFRTGSVRDFEVRLKKRDGSEMDCLLTASRRRTPDGTNLGIQGLVRDITERKRAEQALRDSEERFRRLMEHAADAFFVMDPLGNIVDVNQSACDQWGYSREELLALSAPDIYTNFDESTMRDVYEGLAASKDSATLLDGAARRKDGRTFPIEIH